MQGQKQSIQTLVIKIPVKDRVVLITTPEQSRKEFLLEENMSVHMKEGAAIILKEGKPLMVFSKELFPYITDGKIFKGSAGELCKIKTVTGCDHLPDRLDSNFESPIRTFPANIMGITLQELL